MSDRARLALAAVLTALITTTLHAGEPKRSPAPLPSAVYKVGHSLVVEDIPDGAKKVRVWFWFPDDEPNQKVLDYAVTQAPANYRLTRDPVNGHRYLYAEADEPKGKLVLATEFTLRRMATHVALNPAKAGPITAAHRRLFAEYLRADCPCMVVDDRIAELANKICGAETNVVVQARKLFDWVVANTDHYSKSKEAPKSSGEGSALYCLNQKGGGCTDQHALFIAMARARGIPTRLQFGSRLNPAHEGKDHDPGYRCWVQYFVPHYGWVSTDMSAADTNPGQEDFYFSGLDERRIWFLEGRDLELNPKQAGDRLNLLIVAHVEVDGRPHAAFKRQVRFTRLGDGR
jgi:transglutaminase-like putative cysteine protease